MKPILFLTGTALWFAVPAQTQETAKSGDTKTPLARIASVRAAEERDSTLVDIVVLGKTLPTLSGDTRSIVVTMPNTLPGANLASSLVSGGLVSRIGVETLGTTPRDTRLTLQLSASARAELLAVPNGNTVRVRVQPDEKPAPEPLHRLSNGLFDVNAFQTDVAALLKMLAQETGIGIIVGSSVNGKVTFDLKQASMERVLDYATKSAGLLYRREGSAYFVGTEKDIAAAYPAPKTEPPAVKIPVMQQAIYRCRYISATNLVTTLEKMFDKEQLRVSLGVSPISPRLSGGNNTGGGSASSSGGSSGSAGGGGSQPSGTSSGSGSGASVGSSGIEAREVILYGDAPQVERAMQMAQQLDVRRKQVRIVVRITDISNNALRELGLQYNYSSFSISERTPSAAGSTPAGTTAAAPSGIDFGSFTRSPFSISATLSALEKNDRAKLLAAPTLSLLDGEQGYILIGDRLVYPKLIGYTQAQTPIFDKAEERVGIYLQLAALLSDDGEITLTIYPQVSVVTGYLTVNGASYPQISTREQQTTVRVKDRQEIVVGGLIRNEELFNQQSVPILSRIPLFGELFRYRKRTKNQSELIVTITPEILKD